MAKIFWFVLLISIFGCCTGSSNNKLKTGAEQPELYLPVLKNKKVGLVVNNTSRINNTHLVDFLISENIHIETIFAPEHGFRGDVSAGETIKDGVDSITGIRVISLYGKTKKPTIEHLQNIDLVVFDIQDVGCRFYTYISTLHLVLEACAENDIPLLVLDRPNPNGDYVAGPVLKPGFQSFVGLDPIPVVHGCTIGEYAKMVNGENWHKADMRCKLEVIPVKNYTHSIIYNLPVKPSPNLPNYLSVRLYPSLCFFEATSVSVGRGTDYPFQVLGGLDSSLGNFQFTPKSIPGVSANPLNKDKQCFGIDLRELEEVPKFTLKYFLDFYCKFKKKEDFITRENWLNTLAGTDKLIQQLKMGKSETEILESWQSDLENYKKDPS